MRGPPLGHSRCPRDKGSGIQSLVGWARLAEAGPGAGPGPPGLRVGGARAWMQAPPKGVGSSLINRMVGQMDGQPGLLWAPAPCPPVSSPASGLGGRDSAGLWQG